MRSYLNEHCTYTSDPPQPTDGADPVLYFQNESHAGSSTQFASAAVVLCRMLGRVLRGINAIPLIGGLNRILGFAFGFVSGLLNCWIWSILLWVAANLTGGKLEFLTTATLNRSVIYGLLANLNPFLTRY